MMDKKCIGQIGEKMCNFRYFQELKMSFSKHRQKPQVDSNSLPAVHKHNTLTTEL